MAALIADAGKRAKMVSAGLTKQAGNEADDGALGSMRTLSPIATAAFALMFSAFAASSSAPALAQDWLSPLQDLAKQLSGPSKAPGTRPNGPTPPSKPVVTRPSVAPVPPPIPLARPDFPSDAVPAEAVDAAAPDAAPAVETEPAAEPVVTPEAEKPDVEALPVPRPAEEPEAPVAEEAIEPEEAAEPAEPAEPARVYQAACPALIQGQVEGRMLPPLAEGQCGNQSPLELTAVLSRGRMVPFSEPVTTDCGMATALPAWVAQVDGYAQSMLDSELAQINTGPGYMCRNRNGAESGFLSEHGFANALDVGGFTLGDGRTVAVKSNWLPANVPEGRLLRLAHDAACGSFTTVLGPEANADHEDHLHLDLGCHGKTCTALLCE